MTVKKDFRKKKEKKDKKGNKYTAEIEEIVAYLNQMSGQHYRPTSQNAVKNITARLNEGFTVDDCKTVIYKKVKEWRGTERAKYIRPETLFGTKFESYLNQIGDVGQHDAIDDFLKGEDNDETGIW